MSDTKETADELNPCQFPLTIPELVRLAYYNAIDKGFHEGEMNIPEKLALIHEEVSEALGEYRSKRPVCETYYSAPHPGGGEVRYAEGAGPTTGKPEGFAVELADVMIRVADLCGRLNLDLEGAIRKKMQYNRTRPHMHNRNC